MSALADLDVWIVDASQLTVEEIRATVERMKQDHPNLGMVMIDYIGLMKLAKAERHDLAVGQLSWSLKMMAKELRVPVAALAQLSRRVEERPNKRPNNSDLRDSGNLEQDADRIIMVYRDGYYNEQSVAREYMEIIVSKTVTGKRGLFTSGLTTTATSYHATRPARRQLASSQCNNVRLQADSHHETTRITHLFN